MGNGKKASGHKRKGGVRLSFVAELAADYDAARKSISPNNPDFRRLDGIAGSLGLLAALMRHHKPPRDVVDLDRTPFVWRGDVLAAV